MTKLDDIYKSKCDVLSNSLHIVNDYIYHFEYGENRNYTVEEEKRCYNEMVILVKNGEVLNVFAEILSKDDNERTIDKLIDLQHRYINLIRNEIGNKTIKFSKNDFMIIKRNEM